MPDFHNPYNFVPAPPREMNDPDLGDHVPPPQDVFCPDGYTGWIRVRMTAVTPLLVPHAEKVIEDKRTGHKIFPLRVDSQGKPLIPASSLRGMLRTAYEMVTNSRFGRFSEELRSRLALRMEAREGLGLIPARVENGHFHLLTGTSSVRQDGRPNGPMYAAWLPRYSGHDKNTHNALKYPDGSLPQHGEKVVCWIEKIQHINPRFQFWRVRKIVRGGALNALGNRPHPSRREQRTQPANPAAMKQIYGWVCITNANINRKHDERVFFIDGEEKIQPIQVQKKHRRMWQELIQNYQAIHEDDLKKRRARGIGPNQYLGRDPGQTAWSRHVYCKEDLELKEGTLCYVRLNKAKNDVEAVFPVMISRELYPCSPWELLPPSLRPAEEIQQLSPADRVFGWVRLQPGQGDRDAGKQVAVRGLLRVGPVRCRSPKEKAVACFKDQDPQGVPLAILSTPKPQQGRFYVAASPQGEAQADGLSKQQAGYAPGKGLRGRKVYPHHKNLPQGYWDNPTEDRTQTRQGLFYQEYRRPRLNGREQRDDQNRSVLGWVKPGAEFEFTLHVQNLSQVELGALLWLLSLPKEHYLRFGGGKPLGFGSVRLEINELDLRTGQELRERYKSWCDQAGNAKQNDSLKQKLVQAFQAAVVRCYGKKSENDEPAERNRAFENVSFIRAFLVACQGFPRLPIHYPRTTPNGQPGPPSPQGESFKWFVANERGAKLALRHLVGDTGLPTLQDNQAGGFRGGGRPRRNLRQGRRSRP